MSAAGLPEKIFKGTVAALLPDINATTRTLKARVVLANPGEYLKPGMYATLDFGSAAQAALMVPSEAVIQTGTRAVVIVATYERDSRWEPAPLSRAKSVLALLDNAVNVRSNPESALDATSRMRSQGSSRR